MNWPYFSDPSLSIRGLFKTEPHDFLVEEVPLYLPGGSGEHLYLWIEKIGLTTDQVVQQLSRHLGIKSRDIGVAGKKDRLGIARQWISVSQVPPRRVEKLDLPGVRILALQYHRNKLKPGHLKENRFQIRLREVSDGAQQVANQILEFLQRRGVPNYFGPQRFGVRGDNPAIGLSILKGDWPNLFRLVLGSPSERLDTGPVFQAKKLFTRKKYAEALALWPANQFFARNALRRLIECDGEYARAAKRLPRKQLQFFLHALQSYWFNCCLARRVPSIAEVWPGDLAYLHRNGAVFLVRDADMEQPRVNRFEISPSGPLLGAKKLFPEGREWEIEKGVFSEAHIDPDEAVPLFQRWHVNGQRRAYRIFLAGFVAQQSGEDLVLKFSLPAGSYATTIIRELLKENFPEPEIKIV